MCAKYAFFYSASSTQFGKTLDIHTKYGCNNIHCRWIPIDIFTSGAIFVLSQFSESCSQSSTLTGKKEIIKFMYTSEKLLPHTTFLIDDKCQRTALKSISCIRSTNSVPNYCWMPCWMKSGKRSKSQVGEREREKKWLIWMNCYEHIMLKIRSCIGHNWIAINCRTAK